MWIWLLAVFVIIGSWVGGYFLEWPLWLKILLTVLAVLMVVGWIIARRRARRDEGARARARAPQAGGATGAQRPARSARRDPGAPGADAAGPVGAQGRAASAPSGGSALYTLPWYMIIGPPGAGKTTALKHSGLVFPALDPRTRRRACGASAGRATATGGSRTRPSSSTRPGRYATEADDHDEWISFVDMLRKYRSREAHQRRHRRHQRDRPDGGDGRADRVVRQEAPRAHRRGDQPPPHGRPRLRGLHEGGPRRRLRRVLGRSPQERARPDLGHDAACSRGRTSATPARRSTRSSTRSSSGSTPAR